MSFSNDAEVSWAHGVDLHTGLPKLDNTAAALVSSDFGLAVEFVGTNYIDWGSVFGGSGTLTYAGAGIYAGWAGSGANVLSQGDRAAFRPNGDNAQASWYTFSFAHGWDDTAVGGVIEGTGTVAQSLPFTFVCLHDGVTNTLYAKQDGVVSVVTVPCFPRDSDPHPLRAGLDDETSRSIFGKLSHILASSEVATDAWARAFLDDPTIIESGPTFNAAWAGNSNAVIQS